MNIVWTPCYSLPNTVDPVLYAGRSGNFELWVEVIQYCPEEPERPGKRWVWMIDGPDSDDITNLLASGVEFSASAACQTAERALQLRQKGVSSKI